jgi:hypothetical protein
MPDRRSDSAVWAAMPPSPGVAVTRAHRGPYDQSVLAISGGIASQQVPYNDLLRNFLPHELAEGHAGRATSCMFARHGRAPCAWQRAYLILRTGSIVPGKRDGTSSPIPRPLSASGIGHR